MADAHAEDSSHGQASTGTPAGGHSHDETHELPVRVFLLVRGGGGQ